ncbi:Hypothetical predicted protein [Xyrichtys novacula]|uniref:Large ribosomal subunit protein mL46 n=1 Tax=Xyrichtys novacula TaxID=13765 RepID=A0AAV1EIZ9_XYRNO|nr:Hypothetical predicted protein [Xyrichtys novacula]
MSAPCGRMASRSLFQFLSTFGRTALGNSGLRHFSGTSARRVTAQSKVETERASSPWTLVAAVCLRRLPVISADCSPIEEEVRGMLQQVEFEKSILSDHELRLLDDTERMTRKQAEDYDSDEEDVRKDQEIVLTQDLEDSWEQRMKTFQPAERFRDDVDKDLTSLERCLDSSLLLLAEQEVGGEKMWLLPQTQWQGGETLRQTAERALASLPAAAFKATFLGNAPCGVYKYKLPKAARTESTVGTKVFFFKAILSDDSPPADPNASLLWVKKNELQRYLKPAYLMKVEPFIIGL